MSVVNSLLGRDLDRMAGERSAFVSDPRIDWRVQREANFTFKEGMTKGEMAERDQALDREQFEAKAVDNLNGPPPEDICDVSGLSPARAEWARYRAWQEIMVRQLCDLEQRQAELKAMVAAVGPVKAERWAAVRQSAAALLGRAESGSEVDAKGLAERVAVAEHKAEAAKLALQELESEIAQARIRADHVSRRESAFLFPALVEVAADAGLGADYINAISALRSVANLIFGLIEVVHTYGSGFERPTGPIALPRINMPSVATTQRDFVIDNHGSREIWEKMAEALRRDPRQNLVNFIKPPGPAPSCWPWGK